MILSKKQPCTGSTEEEQSQKNESDRRQLSDDVDAKVATCGPLVIQASCLISVLRAKLAMSERQESTERVAELVLVLNDLCAEANEAGTDSLEIMTALLYLFLKTHENLLVDDEGYRERAEWVSGVVGAAMKKDAKEEAEYEPAPKRQHDVAFG
jgi:hypothetical protein